MQFWEDFSVGETRKFGTMTVSRNDIITFARQFDPQPFHVNEEAARRHRFGGLIASGLHTTALGMRLLVDHVLTDSTSLGSPGVKRLRWPHPVRPGDRLRAQLHVTDKRRSRSRPGVGLVDSRLKLFNQRDETVLCMEATILFRVREAGKARPSTL